MGRAAHFEQSGTHRGEPRLQCIHSRGISGVGVEGPLQLTKLCGVDRLTRALERAQAVRPSLKRRHIGVIEGHATERTLHPTRFFGEVVGRTSQRARSGTQVLDCGLGQVVGLLVDGPVQRLQCRDRARMEAIHLADRLDRLRRARPPRRRHRFGERRHRVPGLWKASLSSMGAEVGGVGHRQGIGVRVALAAGGGEDGQHHRQSRHGEQNTHCNDVLDGWEDRRGQRDEEWEGGPAHREHRPPVPLEEVEGRAGQGEVLGVRLEAQRAGRSRQAHRRDLVGAVDQPELFVVDRTRDAQDGCRDTGFTGHRGGQLLLGGVGFVADTEGLLEPADDGLADAVDLASRCAPPAMFLAQGRATGVVVAAFFDHDRPGAGRQVLAGHRCGAAGRWRRQSPTGEQLADLGRTVGAVGAVGTQERFDGGRDLGGEVGTGLGQRHELFVELGLQRTHGVVDREGRLAGGRQVEARAEAVEVGAGVGAFALVHLGSGVAHGAQEAGGAGLGGLHRARQPEVGDHRIPATGVDHDIRRGEVAVENARGVGIREGTGQAQPQRAHIFDGQRPPRRNVLPERATGVEGHRQGQLAIELVEVEGRQHPIAAQQSRRLHFPPQPPTRRWVGRQVGVHHLERHPFIPEEVDREMHGGRATPSNHTEQTEATPEHRLWRGRSHAAAYPVQPEPS